MGTKTVVSRRTLPLPARRRGEHNRLERTAQASLPFHSDTLILKTSPTRSSVLLPAPSPALPAAMADTTSMRGHLATARVTQLVDIVR